MDAKVFKMHHKIANSSQDKTFSLNCFRSMTTSQLENREFYIFNSSSTFELDIFSYYEIK